MSCGSDGASVIHNILAGEVFLQFKDEDVVVAVLIGVADGHVPYPKVREALANRPIFVVAAVVLDDGDVAWLSCGGALVVLFEGVVFLVNDNVWCVVIGEFPDFDLFDVGKFVPIGIPAGIAGHPNVLSLTEITRSIVPKNAQRVRALGCNCHVVVAVAVEVGNGDVHRVAVGGVGARHRRTGGRGECECGAEHHQYSEENAADSGLREVALGLHRHQYFRQALLPFNAFVLRFARHGAQEPETAMLYPKFISKFHS